MVVNVFSVKNYCKGTFKIKNVNADTKLKPNLILRQIIKTNVQDTQHARLRDFTLFARIA